MEKETFTYGGFTFEPRGKFKDFGVKEDFRSISATLNSCNFGYVADGDEKFNYDDFYKAAGGCDDDVFRCVENNILYVPCVKSLQIFTPSPHDCDGVTEAYHRRRAAHEEHVRFQKNEALKNAMCLEDAQRYAIEDLRKAACRCCDLGLNFAADGTDVYVFRADLLEDITGDMVPANGQAQINEGMYLAIENIWDACDGLYANPKEV